MSDAEYRDLRQHKIEDLLNRTEQLPAVGSEGQIRSILAVVARCTIELADRLAQLSADIQNAQFTLGTRLTELNKELQDSRMELSQASRITSRQTEALVRWTKVLGVMAAAYTVITGGLLIVAILKK